MSKEPDVKIKPEEISIDKDGKVTISNPAFSSKLSAELEKIKTSSQPVPLGFISVDIIC